MKVRPAKKEDCMEISRLFTVLDFEKYSPSDSKRVRAYVEKGEGFVATNNGKVVAAMLLKLEEFCYEIITIASSMKGGGTALVKFALQKCKKEKVPKLWCWSLKRYKAKGFYEKMGFEECYLLKKHGFGEDCYIIGKVIN